MVHPPAKSGEQTVQPAVVQQPQARTSVDDPQNLDAATGQGQGQTTDSYAALLQLPKSASAVTLDVLGTPHQQEVSTTPQQQQQQVSTATRRQETPTTPQQQEKGEELESTRVSPHYDLSLTTSWE